MISLSCFGLNALQLAIVAAIITVIADSIGLVAAVTAESEEQQSTAEEKQVIEDQIRYLQNKLRNLQ